MYTNLMIIDSLAHSHTQIIPKLNRQVLILWVDLLNMSLFNSIFPGLKMQSSDFKGQVYPLGEVEVPGIIPKRNENQQRCEGTHGFGVWEG